MRNSLLPLIAAVILFAIGVLLIRPTVSRGQGGPEVNAGILRLPKRDPIRTVSSQLADSTVAKLAYGSPDAGRWRVVVIAGDDRQPTTHAAMLALGEALYAAGVVAVLDPLLAISEPTPPLPLPADRIIRIATRAAAIGATPTEAWSTTLAFTCSEPRLPTGHPASGLLPGSTTSDSLVVVEHHGQPTDGQQPGWPERWAATGRCVVQAMLAALLPSPGLQRAVEPFASDWGSPLPFPPSTPELRWSGAFQHDLVRGWIGRIHGRSVSTSGGGSESAIEPLVRRLKSGDWQAIEAEGSWRLWSRLRDGSRQAFAVRDDGDGWTATMWLERPDVASLIDRWIQAADIPGRAHLRLALSAPALPEALRVRIEQALQ